MGTYVLFCLFLLDSQRSRVLPSCRALTAAVGPSAWLRFGLVLGPSISGSSEASLDLYEPHTVDLEWQHATPKLLWPEEENSFSNVG